MGGRHTAQTKGIHNIVGYRKRRHNGDEMNKHKGESRVVLMMEIDDWDRKGEGKRCTARKGTGKEKRRVGFIFTCQQHFRP